MFPKIFIIIPTFNEKENIEKLIKNIFALKIDNLEIIIVDDNSLDGTKEIIQNLSKKFNKLTPIFRKGQKNFAQSYLEGFKIALENNAKYIIQMDADFSHNPLYLKEIIKNLKDNDVVIGSRYTNGGSIKRWPFWRKFLSKIGNLFAAFVINTKINDLTTGFVGWHGLILKKIISKKITTNGYAFLIELKYLALNNNDRIKEIPIIFTDRLNDKSKMNKKIILEAMLFCIKLLFNQFLYNKRKNN